MGKITVPAKLAELDRVLAFVDEQLEQADCPVREQMKIDVAVEEIFVNVALYAYDDVEGLCSIACDILDNPRRVELVFSDQGKPYNPLEQEEPDIVSSAEERPIGGLGIFMVKKTMSDLSYEYQNGCNVLTIHKSL